MVLQYKGFDGLWKCLLNSKLKRFILLAYGWLLSKHVKRRRRFFKESFETEPEKQYYVTNESAQRARSFKCKFRVAKFKVFMN